MICLIFMHPLKVPWKVSKLISTYYEILGFAMLLKDDLQHISQWLKVCINVSFEFHTKILKKQRLIYSDFLATSKVEILNFSILYLNFIRRLFEWFSNTMDNAIWEKSLMCYETLNHTVSPLALKLLLCIIRLYCPADFMPKSNGPKQ